MWSGGYLERVSATAVAPLKQLKYLPLRIEGLVKFRIGKRPKLCCVTSFCKLLFCVKIRL